MERVVDLVIGFACGWVFDVLTGYVLWHLAGYLVGVARRRASRPR